MKAEWDSVQFSHFVVVAVLAEIVKTAPDDGTRHVSCHQH